MRKLSNTFLTVSMILSIVAIALWIIIAVVFFILGSPVCGDFLAQGYREGWVHVTGAHSEEAAVAAAQIMFISLGVCFVIVGLFAIPSAVVSAKARNSQNKAILIWAIVLSALSGTSFGIPGGVLGIIATDKERRSKVVDAQ